MLASQLCGLERIQIAQVRLWISVYMAGNCSGIALNPFSNGTSML